MKKTLYLLALLCAALGSAQQKQVNIYFDTASNSLGVPAVKTIDSLIDAAKAIADYRIHITGYTDPVGSTDANYQLGMKRATAAKDYLVKKGLKESAIITLSKGEEEARDQSSEHHRRRRATLALSSIELQSLPSGYEERTFRGQSGTIVTGSFPVGSGATVTVSEFFTSESMIANSMYAMDTNGNILLSCGMIEICTEDVKFDPTGKFFIVKVPSRGRADTRMTLWLSDQVNSGTRWRETPIEVTVEDGYYVFKVPVTENRCLKINLDMPCIVSNNCEVVFIATHKPYNFTDVQVKTDSRALAFSAQVNDTLYAFTKGRGESMVDMKFVGLRSGRPYLTIGLDKCKFSRDRGTSYYYICEDCLKTKKKGFFAWLQKVFTGKEQYEEIEINEQ